MFKAIVRKHAYSFKPLNIRMLPAAGYFSFSIKTEDSWLAAQSKPLESPII